jgi:hypothetical protein
MLSSIKSIQMKKKEHIFAYFQLKFYYKNTLTKCKKQKVLMKPSDVVKAPF